MTPVIPEQLRKYRERHVIRPVVRSVRLHTSYRCEHDDLTIYRIFGGWRHDRDQIRALS